MVAGCKICGSTDYNSSGKCPRCLRKPEVQFYGYRVAEWIPNRIETLRTALEKAERERDELKNRIMGWVDALEHAENVDDFIIFNMLKEMKEADR